MTDIISNSDPLAPQEGDDQLHTMYKSLIKQLMETDEVLDALSDSKGAGKRAIRNELVKNTESFWMPGVNNIVAKINEVSEKAGDNSDEVKFGIFLGFIRQLNEIYGKDEDVFTSARVDNQPKQDKPAISEDDLRELSEQRKATYTNAKNLFDFMSNMGFDVSHLPEPRKRTGASGPRGARAISLYNWSVGGEALQGENNKLIYVAKNWNYGTVAELRKAIAKSLGIKDLKDPPATFNFTLSDGQLLTGTKKTEEEVQSGDVNVDDDDDDDDDDENDDDKVEGTDL